MTLALYAHMNKKKTEEKRKLPEEIITAQTYFELIKKECS
jgi:hypothetical protein